MHHVLYNLFLILLACMMLFLLCKFILYRKRLIQYQLTFENHVTVHRALSDCLYWLYTFTTIALNDHKNTSLYMIPLQRSLDRVALYASMAAYGGSADSAQVQICYQALKSLFHSVLDMYVSLLSCMLDSDLQSSSEERLQWIESLCTQSMESKDLPSYLPSDVRRIWPQWIRAFQELGKIWNTLYPVSWKNENGMSTTGTSDRVWFTFFQTWFKWVYYHLQEEALHEISTQTMLLQTVQNIYPWPSLSRVVHSSNTTTHSLHSTLASILSRSLSTSTTMTTTSTVCPNGTTCHRNRKSTPHLRQT